MQLLNVKIFIKEGGRGVPDSIFIIKLIKIYFYICIFECIIYMAKR